MQAELTQHEVGPVHPIPAHWDQSEPHCAAAAAAELLKARSRGSACWGEGDRGGGEARSEQRECLLG